MSTPARIAWVDYAKGICIVLVVMMHSTLGVEAAAGGESWMHGFVAFAGPFRMPDFFLLAGLFLARTVDRPWPTYVDRKVLHFAYFYVLWLLIQFAFKAPGMVVESGTAATFQLFALSFIEPFGTMWFIYALPIFFVVTKLVRNVPVWLVWLVAAALEMSDLTTGWLIIDEFADKYVYFFTGYAFAPAAFAFAERVADRPRAALAGLVGWAVVNAAAVWFGIAGAPIVSLALGLAGAGAVIAMSVLLLRLPVTDLLRYAGEHSLVIYLAFFLPMAVGRVVLLELDLIPDLGAVALIVTMGAVAAPLVLNWLVQATPIRFLFVRPEWARLRPRRTDLAPAQ